MTSPDLKKLVTIFLILAAVVSSSLLIFSGFPGGTSRPSANSPAGITGIGSNAFAPTNLPNGSGAFTSAGSANQGFAHSGNLTEAVADSLAQSILQKNPDGPKTVKDKLAITFPGGSTDFAKDYVAKNGITLQSIDPEIDIALIKTQAHYSSDDVKNYFTTLQPIISSIAGNRILLDARAGGDASTANALNLLFVEASAKLYGLNVPAPLLSYHKTLLKIFGTYANAFNASANDPLKTLFLVANFKQIITGESVALHEETKNLKQQLPQILGSLRHEKKLGDHVRAILGVETAYAIFGIEDIVIDLPTEIETALTAVNTALKYVIDYNTWYGRILTEVLKNTILKLIVDAIVNWVTGRGSGNPQFVTNWKSMLGNAFNGAAGAVIEQNAPGLCSSFGPLVSIGLKPVQLRQTGIYSPTYCTLDRVVSNLQGFYNNFESGGWIGYTTLLEPQNNLFGSIVQNSDLALQAGLEAQNAAQSQAQAGNGYKGTETCDDNSSPDEDGQCADGSILLITTPGSQQSDLTSRALASPIDRIVNANGWESLAAGVITGVINNLIASGNKGLAQGNITSANPVPTSILCSGYATSSPEYANCIQGIKDSNAPPGSENSGPKAILLAQAKQILTDSSSTMAYVNASLEAVTSTAAILNVIAAAISTCPSQAAQARLALNDKNAEYNTLILQASDLRTRVLGLKAFITDIETHQPTNDIAYFTKQTGVLQSQFGTPQQASLAKSSAYAQSQSDAKDLQSASDLLKSCTGG